MKEKRAPPGVGCFLGDISLLGIIMMIVLSIEMTGFLKKYTAHSGSLKEIVDQTVDRRQPNYRCQQCEEKGYRD